MIYEENRPTVGFSRRAFLRSAATATAGAVLGQTMLGAGSARAAASQPASGGFAALMPQPAISSILSAIDTHPLVAIGEHHDVQDLHDVLAALLHHPELAEKIDDIAVEFGNARYQDLMDRFILDREPVRRVELSKVWRACGEVAWDAPVYEQFFRTVRAVNWALPASKRIRVLLGQPSVTMAQVIAHPNQQGRLREFDDAIDRHMGDVVRREVVDKGRRALILAGDGHALKGLEAPGEPGRPNVATLLEEQAPGSLYSIDLLLIPPSPTDPALAELLHSAESWPQPSVIPIAGTSLGGLTAPLDATRWVNALGSRALMPEYKAYERQADAILWLGPGSAITSSQPDAAIYHWGRYPTELKRLEPIVKKSPSLVSYGLLTATGPANWFAQISQTAEKPKIRKLKTKKPG